MARVEDLPEFQRLVRTIHKYRKDILTEEEIETLTRAKISNDAQWDNAVSPWFDARGLWLETTQVDRHYRVMYDESWPEAYWTIFGRQHDPDFGEDIGPRDLIRARTAVLVYLHNRAERN